MALTRRLKSFALQSGFESREKDIRWFVISPAFGLRLVQFALMLGIVAGENGAVVANHGPEIRGVTEAGQLEHLVGLSAFETPDL